VMAMLVVWYGRHLSYVRWFALALNSIVLVATPIEGGHHVVDVLAGFAVATAAVLFADWIVRRAAAAHAPLAITTQAAGV